MAYRNAEDARAACREHYKRNKQWYLDRNRQRRYGLSPQQYDEMRRAQNNCCAICAIEFAEAGTRGPYVDHDHRTGRVRSLLCAKCNTKLSVLESPMRAALEEYLRRHAS